MCLLFLPLLAHFKGSLNQINKSENGARFRVCELFLPPSPTPPRVQAGKQVKAHGPFSLMLKGAKNAAICDKSKIKYESINK